MKLQTFNARWTAEEKAAACDLAQVLGMSQTQAVAFAVCEALERRQEDTRAQETGNGHAVSIADARALFGRSGPALAGLRVVTEAEGSMDQATPLPPAG